MEQKIDDEDMKSYYLNNKDKLDTYAKNRHVTIKYNCHLCNQIYCGNSIYLHIISGKHIKKLKEKNDPFFEAITKIETKPDGKKVSSKWESHGIKPREQPKKQKCEICNKEIYDLNSHYKSRAH